MRSLRTLAPVRLSEPRQTIVSQRMRRAAFAIALLAVMLKFAISANLLEAIGIDYAGPGGNPLIKLHPGTYLVMIAAFMVLVLAPPPGSGLPRLFRVTPALGAFIMLTLVCAAYSIANAGFSGATIYVESYLSAGMLAVALEGGTDRQKRALAWWILGLCVVSIAISIGEAATGRHLIPLHSGDATAAQLTMNAEDFRATGLFADPVTAALTTSMATFLLLRMRMNGFLRVALFITFLIGLLSFGGRAGLGLALVMLTLVAAATLLRGIVTRNLGIGFVGTIAAAVVILPSLMLFGVTGTDIGEPILRHLYLDESTGVHGLQWLVLGHLDLHGAMFGVPLDRLDDWKYQFGLATDITGIENYWLLMFLNLGAIGFVVFLSALGLFLMHLGRTTGHPLGWMLLIASIAVETTSDAVGSKSADLFLLTASLIAMTGYRSVVAAGAVSFRRKAPTGPGRTSNRLGVRPTPANLTGLRS
jgi:hypothetical protein